MPFDDSRQRVVERVSLREMPDRQGQSPPGLEHSQHLANRVDRRGKEHHAEAADHGIEGIGLKRQMVSKGDFKLTFFNPRRSAARRAAATISGIGSIPKILPPGPTKAATLKAGSPGPIAISRTAC